jgi:hypothetical protein
VAIAGSTRCGDSCPIPILSLVAKVEIEVTTPTVPPVTALVIVVIVTTVVAAVISPPIFAVVTAILIGIASDLQHLTDPAEQPARRAAALFAGTVCHHIEEVIEHWRAPCVWDTAGIETNRKTPAASQNG